MGSIDRAVERTLGEHRIREEMLPLLRRPGDRVKTDRRDARVLARLRGSGELTSVWVPDEHLETLRDQVRVREDSRQDQQRKQHQLGLRFRYRPAPWRGSVQAVTLALPTPAPK